LDSSLFFYAESKWLLGRIPSFIGFASTRIIRTWRIKAITCKDKLMLSLLLAFKSMEATANIFICGMKEFELEFTVQICLAGR